jgi:hypothetical protein
MHRHEEQLPSKRTARGVRIDRYWLDGGAVLLVPIVRDWQIFNLVVDVREIIRRSQRDARGASKTT